MSLDEKRMCGSGDDFVYPERDLKQAIKELREKLIIPNVKSKNYIEVSEFLYALQGVFGEGLI